MKRIRVGQHATLAVHPEPREEPSACSTEDATAPVACNSHEGARDTGGDALKVAEESRARQWNGEGWSMDRRHDTWREGGSFAAVARLSASPSGSSDHGDSPR